MSQLLPRSRISFHADSLLRTSLITEKATLAGSIVNFQSLEVDHIWQGTGFYTDTTAGTIFFFDLRARANQPRAIEGCAKMLATLYNPGIWVIQRVHHPEDKAIESFLLW